MTSTSRPRARPQIRVRMYRVGFGDCFLVTFPGSANILVDCGVHARGNIGTLDAVIDDIAKTTKRKLAAIVMSHAHEDHIAGFLRGEEVFRTFDIGSVWLPWTENPEDGLARKLRQGHARLFEALAQQFAAKPGTEEVQALLDNAAAAAGRNTRALDNLRSGFGTKAQVHWFEKGDSIAKVAGVPGLSVRFLGPPRDEAFLKKMDPPKPERYLRLGVDGKPTWEDALVPFDEQHTRTSSSAGPVLSTRQEKALQRAVEYSPEALAFALDQALNNTSLVCLFRYRGKSLLFPGDAQYGNWKAWLDADNAAELLRNVSFYKVAHHGSENATPKTALEGMTTGGFAAMLSTQSLPWPSIPYPKLMTAIERQTERRVLRSDSLTWPKAPAGPVVARLPKGFRKGTFWIDYSLPL